MRQTLMRGLTQKDMQAEVNSYNLKPFYYPTLFPLKENLTFTWKALSIMTGLHIAGDIVARGASVDPKTREAIAKLSGELPKVAIKRTKEEEELNEYFMLLALSQGDANQRALIEAWAEDTQFCFNGVASRLEWMALKSISNGGKIILTNANNNSVVSEFDCDYQIDADRKMGYATASWDSPTATPFKDMKRVVKEAKKKGIALKFAFMNTDTFAKMVATEEVVKLCAGFAANALNIATTPTLAHVNTTMLGQADLFGLQIVVIDQDITIEKADHTQVTGNPFDTDVVMFSPSKVLGQTFYKPAVDTLVNGGVALHATNGHTLVKKFSYEEPLQEVTLGLANAFPAWRESQRSFLMDTAHSTWNHTSE